MRGLGLGLVLWALGATVASAAVVRIDVTGTPVLAQISGVQEFDGKQLYTRQDLPISALDRDQPLLSPSQSDIIAAGFEFIGSTTGFLEIQTEGESFPFRNCGGLLRMFCVTPIGFESGDRLLYDFISGRFELSASFTMFGGHRLDNDSYETGFEFIAGLISAGPTQYFVGLSGIELEATITSLSVSVLDQPTPIPLPASAPLILAGLGALALLRRRVAGARPA